MDRLGAMEMFVRVVETKSFSAAARDLKVGQPAVSKAIAQLEERFGVRLLMRSTRGLAPTEAGRNFYARARSIIDAAEEAAIAVSGGELSGRLRASAGVTISRLHIVPRLKVFLDQHPKLSLDLLLSDRPGDLVEDGVDVSFRTGILRDSTLTARKIASCRLLVIGTPAFFERNGVAKNPSELERLPAVVYSSERAGGRDAYRFRRRELEVEVKLRGRLRLSAAEAVREAVLSGLGYTVASEWMFAPELASGEVRAAVTGWLLPPLDCWAVFPTGRLVTAKARAFADFFRGELVRAVLPDSRPPPSREGDGPSTVPSKPSLMKRSKTPPR
jgi:DNA-binding transcriptional LysR family regulator